MLGPCLRNSRLVTRRLPARTGVHSTSNEALVEMALVAGSMIRVECSLN